MAVRGKLGFYCSCGRWARIAIDKLWMWQPGLLMAAKPITAAEVTCDRCGDRLNQDGTVTRAEEVRG